MSSWSAHARILVGLLSVAASPVAGFMAPVSQPFKHHYQHVRSATAAAVATAGAHARGSSSLRASGSSRPRRRKQQHQQRDLGSNGSPLAAGGRSVGISTGAALTSALAARASGREAAGAVHGAAAGAASREAGTKTSGKGGVALGGEEAFADELGVLDAEQAAMMTEECILVDRFDRPTGSASKVETHLSSRGLLLHRAFSVFLFDRQGRVLMQRRADSKHTFASFWTNTCCSHPLWNDVEMGTDLTTPKGDKTASEGDAAVTGAARAAIRKLGQELGIPAAQLPLEDFSFLTKVHYIASSGSTWGEHEIDYVFVIQADVDLDPNPNEVSNAEFLDRDGLRSLLASADRGEVKFTPWSAYIIDQFVFRWWDHVGDKDKLRSFRDDIIHRVGSCADDASAGG